MKHACGGVRGSGFFGVDPSFADREVNWAYNTATYETTSGDFSVRFTISPGSGDFTLIVHRQRLLNFEISVLQALDIRIVSDKGYEALEVALDQRSWLRFQLRPHFQIKQGLFIEYP